MRSLSNLCRFVVIAGCCLQPQYVLAWQDEDDEDIRPGLVERISQGDRTAAAIVTDPILTPSDSGSKAQHVWTGQFLVRGDGPHQFHAFLSGKVSVKLGNQVVLEASSPHPGWVSGPTVELTFGEFPLEIAVDVAHIGDQLKLYWSSNTFPLEPLPYHALFHAEDTTSIRLAERGRGYVEAWRCRSCHTQAAGEQPLPGPSLKTIGVGTDVGWLRERLTRAEPALHSRMPAFGFLGEEADAVLAYLSRDAKPQALADADVKRSEKEVAAGGQLIKSVGCLACHQWRELGKNPLLGGGPLDGVAKHRSPAWILAKLTDPHGVNPASRMPTFPLSDPERRQVVAALMSGDSPKIKLLAKSVNDTDALVARGRGLVREARCGACHELPEDVAPFVFAKPQALDAVDGERSCLGSDVDRRRRQPRFAAIATDAIRAYFAGSRSPVVADLSEELGERLLKTKGCLNCHDRNGARGLSAFVKDIVRTEPTWEGQAPTLLPPSLTAVGDRLPDAVLAKGVRGELPQRMDWLKVRMPKFRHSDSEATALAGYLITHDRIPEDAPATPDYPVSTDKVDPKVMLAGRELTGGKGFSCVACHQLKDYVPPKVALGTRGSDLYRLGERMRAPYYFRWTRSPLRITPGVEMPSYVRPHPTLLDGKIDRQLAAIWDALHDPQFTAPTNPAVVEQLWGPSKDGRPRILRDVFTVPDADGKMTSVPRSFAVGFANRHSVLFDLEHGCVRAWTIGDFARQRTQGKSWFWDLAGVPVVADFPLRPDIYLFDERTRELIAPETGWTPHVRFIRSKLENDASVRFRYELSWSHPGEPESRNLLVYERWAAQENAWRRGVDIEVSPTGHSVWLRRPVLARTFGSPQVSTDRGRWSKPVSDAPDSLLLAEAKAIGNPTWMTYTTNVTPPDVSVNPPVVVPPVPEAVTCLPGFSGERLPLSRSIMPTALAWNDDGLLHFTSLKGHVYRTTLGSNQGASADQLTMVAEGLSAPFGILAVDKKLLVAHKPEVLLLEDTDGDSAFDLANVVASGWGFTDDYHDWTCGIVSDSQGRYYIGLGSDYSHKNRPKTENLWRGNILRFDLQGNVEPIATELRYPTGFAMLPGGRLFVSDQQGVQNCFNELNYIQTGRRYGVPAQLDPRDDAPTEPATVQIPHPWTRSVNGLAAWPDNGHPFGGQIIGADYNGRFLIRASVEEVDGVLQGAVYPLNRPGETNGPEELLGPMCVGFSPAGDLYVGSIHDSGWLGGLNTGDIVKFTPNDSLPNGIQQVRATLAGFAIDFLRPVDRAKASDPGQYQLSGYTRVWQGAYATPDSGRHAPTVTAAEITDNGKTVNLSLDGLKTGHVYDIAVGDIGAGEMLWPSVAHYTLHRQPR